jgi:hypothetical protein
MIVRTYTQKPRKRFVNPHIYPLLKGWRRGVRVASTLALGIYVVSAITLLVSLFIFGPYFDSLIHLLLLVAISGSMAVVFGTLGSKLRAAAVALDGVMPLNNETASQMGLEETLVRAANRSILGGEKELLRISATNSEPHNELVRSYTEIQKPLP